MSIIFASCKLDELQSFLNLMKEHNNKICLYTNKINYETTNLKVLPKQDVEWLKKIV